MITNVYFEIFVLTHDFAVGFIIIYSEKKVAQNKHRCVLPVTS